MAMFCVFGSAVSMLRQAAGDHVQHRGTLAHLHPCFQSCRVDLTILPTHSRWLKVCLKTQLHVTLSLFFFFSLSLFLSFALSLFLSLSRLVGLHVDLILSHSCTIASFVTELVCALDHSSNAFVLAQDCHKIELHLSW